MTDLENQPERALIACNSVEELRDPPVPCEVAKCIACEGTVWITASLYPRVTTGELEPVCLTCLPHVAEAIGEAIETRIHPDQERELAEAGLLDYARSLVDEMNRLQGIQP